MDTQQFQGQQNFQQQGNVPPGTGLMNSVVNQMVSDMKFMAIFTIIYGVITSLGCITALIGVPMIFAGIRLKEAGDFFLAYANSNMKNPELLIQAFEKQRRYFYIYKIIIIVGLILTLLYIVFIIVMISTGMFLGLEELNRYN